MKSKLAEPKTTVYVFETDVSGEHLTRSAAAAIDKYGAVPGLAPGFCGDSYAIAIYDEDHKMLPLSRIEKSINAFIRFAELNPEMHFKVDRIACGRLSLYQEADIARLFKKAPVNCSLPVGWRNM